MRRSWCWHRWTKWSEVKTVGVINPIFKTRGDAEYQDRSCEKCGMVLQRKVDWR